MFEEVWKDHGKPTKTFPLQVSTDVPLRVAEEAYKEYVAMFGRCQTLERLGERGGFGSAEIANLLFYRIQRLKGRRREQLT